MKLLKLKDLHTGDGHILQNLIQGQYLCNGGLSFKKPNQRTHDVGCTCPACDGQGRHVHGEGDCEVFIILQGKAVMEVDGKGYDLAAGDVVVCEPGEDHHLVSNAADPCVNIWLHAGEVRHEDQGG